MSNFSTKKFEGLCYAKKVLLLYLISDCVLSSLNYVFTDIGSNDLELNAIGSNDLGSKDGKTTYGPQHKVKNCNKQVIFFFLREPSNYFALKRPQRSDPLAHPSRSAQSINCHN